MSHDHITSIASRSFAVLIALLALPVAGQTAAAPVAPESKSASVQTSGAPTDKTAGPVVLGQPKTVSLVAPPTKTPAPQPAVAPSKGKTIVRDVAPPPEVVEKARGKSEAAKAARPAPAIKAADTGLPRLVSAEKVKSGAPAPLMGAKFEVDALSVTPNAVGLRKATQANVSYLAIDPAVEWTRALRGGPQDVSFVSLNLHASVATVLDVGGAWLSVLESEKPGWADLVVGEKDKKGGIAWKRIGVQSPHENFGGRKMAALPILTVRRDPAAGTWDLYSGLRPVAHALPLIPEDKKSPAHTLTIRAGSAGVWLNAVALSDESPLFTDANANGIDDAFEVKKKGAILGKNAKASDCEALALDWQKAQRTSPPPPVVAVRPLPDRLLAKIPPPPAK